MASISPWLNNSLSAAAETEPPSIMPSATVSERISVLSFFMACASLRQSVSRGAFIALTASSESEQLLSQNCNTYFLKYHCSPPVHCNSVQRTNGDPQCDGSSDE